MKAIKLLTVSMFFLSGSIIQAKELSLDISCNYSTRGLVSSLILKINPELGLLIYNFDQEDYISNEDYQLIGSNQMGFGTSANSFSEVDLATSTKDHQIKIDANGFYYDRATFIGKDSIQVVIKKIPGLSFKNYKLQKFVVNGVSHGPVDRNIYYCDIY